MTSCFYQCQSQFWLFITKVSCGKPAVSETFLAVKVSWRPFGGPKKQNIEKIPKCTVHQNCTTQRVKLINSYIFSAWFEVTRKKSSDQFVASVFSEIMISTRLLSKSLPPLDFATGRQLVAGTVQICSLLLIL